MNFEEFKLKPEMMRAIHDSRFTEPTAIQEKCIPLILEGRDVVGQSMTGSGKTAAFAIPILEMIEKGKGVQALVLTPTRELCVQITGVVEQLGYHLKVRVASVFGGVSISPQMDAIRSAEIIIGTPGRVLDHLERGTLDLKHIRFLVLDEVDRMSDMGFIDDVERIIHHTPKHRQGLLFSATVTQEVQRLIRNHLTNPVTIQTQSYVETHLLNQMYYNVMKQDKFSLLVHLLKQHQEQFCIVFCATRSEVDRLTRNLKRQDLKAMAIHGGLTQNKRLKAIEMLKEQRLSILVATDVAARGLDIQNVNFIYNYDVPKSSQDYIHRIGRTARAGKSGLAVTLLSDKDFENFGRVLQDRSLKIKCEDTPAFERVRFEAAQQFRGRSPTHGNYHQGHQRGPPQRSGGGSRGNWRR
ncbi:MAG: DEAD/DEAH box helicase [archaeon]